MSPHCVVYSMVLANTSSPLLPGRLTPVLALSPSDITPTNVHKLYHMFCIMQLHNKCHAETTEYIYVYRGALHCYITNRE